MYQLTGVVVFILAALVIVSTASFTFPIPNGMIEDIVVAPFDAVVSVRCWR